MTQTFKAILFIILLLLGLAIGSVMICEGSEIIAIVCKYIIELFDRADLRPNRSGFGAFLQLIMIAVFIGWTIHRFRRK